MLLGSLLSISLGTILCSSLGALADDSAAMLGGPLNQGKDPCPAQCNIAGPVSSNWSVYHNLDQLQRCPQRLFLDFSIYDQIDDPTILHRLRACTVWGDDWDNVPATTTPPLPATSVSAAYELGMWDAAGTKASNKAHLLSLVTGLKTYFADGHAPSNRTAIVFGLFEDTTLGLYLGKALQKEGMGLVALGNFASILSESDFSGGLALQYCGGGLDADHVFGVIANLNDSFASVQSAVQSWSKAECLDGFSQTRIVGGPVFVTAPPLVPISNSTAINGTAVNGTTVNGTLALRQHAVQSGLKGRAAACRRGLYEMSNIASPIFVDVPPITLLGNSTIASGDRSLELARRSDCKTIQVASGDSCASLATKCGIPGAQITVYNPSPTFCSTLQPYQHICCSSGTLPNFAPKQNPDGSCATYTTVADDSCYSIAAQNSLATTDLENFNKKTWGWNGCSNLWVGVIMCLSTGAPPMPAIVPNAVCGPQVPGTVKPPAGTDLSTLNPCLLNACCDVWGQCGTTAEFCTNSSTGAPGTAKAGTNGCISNCGENIIRSGPPATFLSVAYFEGFNLGRPCLNMDVNQIDKSKYTNIHFAFATLTSGYAVVIGDVLSTFEFHEFAALRGIKRILSIGGWDFSTNPSTYAIFRNGVTAANRVTMATNIAKFVIANNLDGVDIDWEYPGAPDIPGIPAASTSDGANYLAFLVILKNLLPGKTVSICAPASYWYLKGFPIKQIGAVVDYVVYMTYDLHGQWDYGNKWSDPGCPGGNCLRSDVNLTETMNSLVMITKAGVPSNKVVVGVTSYGRAYQMTTPLCYGETCTFTGPASGAAAGPCTGVAGYISDAEIKAIATSSSVNFNYLDAQSQTNILVYNNVQWIGWMDPVIKSNRISLYQSLDMGGASNWAVDLEDYESDPIPSQSWTDFIVKVKLGNDPFVEGNRTGNWTSLSCTDPAVQGLATFTPAERWSMLDCNNAWTDAVNAWKTVDRVTGNLNFIQSIANTFHVAEQANCGSLVQDSNCDATIECTDAVGDGSGPAGYEVWNSLVIVHEMYANYHAALFQIASVPLSGIQAFENDFAPLPPTDDLGLQILLDLIGLGSLMVAAPFFDLYLASMPFFLEAGAGVLDTLKDSAYAIISTTISIVKDLTAGSGSVEQWTAAKEADFAAYMGQVLWAWGNVTEQAVSNVFNGSDASIQTLTTLLSNGQLIAGSLNGHGAGATSGLTNPPSDATLQASILASFYAYTIPVVWSVSGTKAFVMDSGYPCGAVNPLQSYLSVDTGDATWACYNNKLYYLVYPSGDATTCHNEPCGPTTCVDNQFSVPPGLDKLVPGNNYGGITLQELITGSVRTYQSNNNKNGAPAASVTNAPTINDLYNQDVTTPGYIRLPVCGPAEAWANWFGVSASINTTYPNYPCNP